MVLTFCTEMTHFLHVCSVGFFSVIYLNVSDVDSVYFALQPDLLNFKKGWMSKLDGSGEVKGYTPVLDHKLLLYLLFNYHRVSCF